MADSSGLPLAICVTNARPHEVELVEQTLDEMFIDEMPNLLIGDKAYDDDPLDHRLAQRGIELIAPHRSNRKKARLKTVESCGVTGVAGKLSDSLPGCITSEDWW